MLDDPYHDVEEEEEEEDEPEVMLGFAEPVDAPGDMLRCQFPSKLGGAPAWLDPVYLPLSSELRCPATDRPMNFLMQIYAAASDEDHAFHRTIFLFVTPSGTAIGRPGAIRAFRCQLPRVNPYYAHEPLERGARPRALDAKEARTAELRCPLWAGVQAATDSGEPADEAKCASEGEAGTSAAALKPYPEYELIVEPEPTVEEAQPDNRVKELVEEFKKSGEKGFEEKGEVAEAAEAAELLGATAQAEGLADPNAGEAAQQQQVIQRQSAAHDIYNARILVALLIREG